MFSLDPRRGFLISIAVMVGSVIAFPIVYFLYAAWFFQ